MVEFMVGYLHRAIHEERELRPLSSVREERQAVVRSGFHARTHFDITHTVRHQLAIAHKGLKDIGAKPDFLNILERRLENKNTAGEYVAKLWQSSYDGSVEDALLEVVADIWQKTRANSPIS
jgi:hypothetical protein